MVVPQLDCTVGGYVQWRPQMENALMRAGVTARDYKEENVDWAALVAAVETWGREEESASFALALGRTATAASSAPAVAPLPRRRQDDRLQSTCHARSVRTACCSKRCRLTCGAWWRAFLKAMPTRCGSGWRLVS